MKHPQRKKAAIDRPHAARKNASLRTQKNTVPLLRDGQPPVRTLRRKGPVYVRLRHEQAQLLDETGAVGNENEAVFTAGTRAANGLHLRNGEGEAEFLVPAGYGAAGPVPGSATAADIWMYHGCIVCAHGKMYVKGRTRIRTAKI